MPSGSRAPRRCTRTCTRGPVPCFRAPLAMILACVAGCAPPWLPDDFTPPDALHTEDFVIRPLTVDDAEADYEAVMESRDIIHRALLSQEWPPEGFTVDDDRREIAIKQRLARDRQSFTFAVLSPSQDRVLGSVYINPGVGGPDAAVFLWVRRAVLANGLDVALERTVRDWMESAWPFEWVVFPGREPPTAAQVQDTLTGVAWAGVLGPDRFVFVIRTIDERAQVTAYSYRDGELKDEMRADSARFEPPVLEMAFPTGSSYRGQMSEGGDSIIGRFFLGDRQGPAMALLREPPLQPDSMS